MGVFAVSMHSRLKSEKKYLCSTLKYLINAQYLIVNTTYRTICSKDVKNEIKKLEKGTVVLHFI